MQAHATSLRATQTVPPPPQHSNAHTEPAQRWQKKKHDGKTCHTTRMHTSLCANSSELASVSRLRVPPSGKCKNMYGTPEGPADTESLAKDARDFLTLSRSSYAYGYYV